MSAFKRSIIIAMYAVRFTQKYIRPTFNKFTETIRERCGKKWEVGPKNNWYVGGGIGGRWEEGGRLPNMVGGE